VLALVAKPETELYDDLRPLVFELRIIDDAKEPRLIMHAVREGFYETYYL